MSSIRSWTILGNPSTQSLRNPLLKFTSVENRIRNFLWLGIRSLLMLQIKIHLRGVRHSQYYSLDRVKVVKRGNHSPDVPLCFKKIVPGQKIAYTKQCKAHEELALAANKLSQLKRNFNVETGENLMRELGSRNNEIANALKTGLNKNTLMFYDRAADAPSREPSASPDPLRQRPSGTSTLESLLLHSPDSVKLYRKCIDRKSGKPLYRPAKFKIVRVTNNTYMTNTGKVYRKNHKALKRNVNKCEILAKRSAAAPVRGVRTGQMPPRKTAPIGQTTAPTQRCPITIVPASHQRRSTAPPVVLLSDSDSQEAVSRIQSPRRSPRAMSTHQPATRI